MTTAHHYANGYALNDDVAAYRESRSRAGIEGAKDAVRSWRRAASDHGHTSYYGAETISHYRAYWLGVARALIHRRRETA